MEILSRGRPEPSGPCGLGMLRADGVRADPPGDGRAKGGNRMSISLQVIASNPTPDAMAYARALERRGARIPNATKKVTGA
jgi:hypothetical protein